MEEVEDPVDTKGVLRNIVTSQVFNESFVFLLVVTYRSWSNSLCHDIYCSIANRELFCERSPDSFQTRSLEAWGWTTRWSTTTCCSRAFNGNEGTPRRSNDMNHGLEGVSGVIKIALSKLDSVIFAKALEIKGVGGNR